MKNNNLLKDLQSAYKVGHGTETTFLCVQNDLLQTVDNGSGAFLVLLDISAAFDSV